MAHVERANPRDDVDFVALVSRLGATALQPGDLQRSLRQAYPDAVVRSSGLAGEQIEVWYVYRDGSWTSPGSMKEPA
jgi:hypothetical protein